MSIPFTKILQAEFKKTKNIYGLSISLAGPAIIVLGITAYLATKLGGIKSEDSYAWMNLHRYAFNFYFFLYPLYTALIGFLLANIEHKNKGFKHLFTLPAPKGYFYVAKILILLFWITASMGLGWILIIVCGHLLNAVFPGRGFGLDYPTAVASTFMIRMYIILLGILAIHYFLSLYFDNFIISVGLGCFMVVAGMAIFQWEYSHWIPYSGPVFSFIEFRGGASEVPDKRLWISLGYAVVFFTAGYFLMGRKAIK